MSVMAESVDDNIEIEDTGESSVVQYLEELTKRQESHQPVTPLESITGFDDDDMADEMRDLNQWEDCDDYSAFTDTENYGRPPTPDWSSRFNAEYELDYYGQQDDPYRPMSPDQEPIDEREIVRLLKQTHEFVSDADDKINELAWKMDTLESMMEEILGTQKTILNYLGQDLT